MLDEQAFTGLELGSVGPDSLPLLAKRPGDERGSPHRLLARHQNPEANSDEAEPGNPTNDLGAHSLGEEGTRQDT